MLKPLNNYVQIEPQTREDFISSADTTYNEVGIVLEVAEGVTRVTKGDTVYFDSWMAAKFPAGEGKYYWLVPFENIKAYEQIPTEPVQGGLSSQVSYSTVTSTGASGEVREVRDSDVLPPQHP